MKKIYCIRKYVLANSAQEALNKERKAQVDDVWVDEGTHKEYLQQLQANEIKGFKNKK